MSISSAYHSAMSGLVAAGRASDVVSSNIANAMTEGYARRELLLGSATESGAGVRVLGVRRVIDPAITQGRRVAEAEQQAATATAEFRGTVERLIGTPDEPGSLSARLGNLDAALTIAAARPDSDQRLADVVRAADHLVSGFNAASRGVDDLRTRADRSIAAQVDRLNSALGQVQRLNAQITAMESGGGETASMLDQRRQLIDEINVIVPVREMPRQNGQVALYSEGGALLLDGPAATLGFAAANLVTADMTPSPGTLSGLTLNGLDLRTGGPRNAISGGTLAAAFAVRDDLGPEAHQRLDAAARDMIDRLAQADPTLAVGAPGLLTDAGGPATTAPGLAGRIAVNSAVDPAAGAPWRLRDGIGAAAPGAAGNAAGLNALSQALANGPPRPAAAILSDLASWGTSARLTAERAQSLSAAGLAEIGALERGLGVDTDNELQMLMLIEKTYAANVRVIETVDEMMSTLLRL
jgi:flagellar hook-associated protein 1 FlgK